MACDKALLVQAYVDGELDPAGLLEIEAHLGACAACRQLVANVTELRNSLHSLPRHHAVPPGLEMRVLRALDVIDAEARNVLGWRERLRRLVAVRRQWFAGAAAGIALAGAVAAAVLLLLPSEENDRVLDELASAHLRSLMAEHLLDIGSSDGQTVSPWFKGRVDVSPPVVDLSAQGFDLVGGRADFIDGKRVAAVVYGHGSHVINLFVWSDYEEHPSGVAERDGYNLVMWGTNDLVFCAVSDASVGDLKSLAQLVTAGITPNRN